MKSAFKILIADDSEVFRKLLIKHIQKINPDFEIYTAKDGLEASEILQTQNINLAFLDNIMPEYSGLELVKYAEETALKTKIVIISGYGSISLAVEALKYGALGFIEKPIMKDDYRKINEYIYNLSSNKSISTIKNQTPNKRVLIGKNKKIREIKELIEKISYSPSNVFIMGESGTGKDIVAEMIHNKSRRKDKPFITVNCSALPENLIESELFGYKKGAFTGAINDRTGLFEEADKGTLFLDEIGDMPLFTQAKVLRAIQNREIKPIGSNKIINVDVRIIAATNKDIKEEIKKGKFRRDLWYRLNVFSISIPPLRERSDDIAILALHFLKKFNKILGKQINGITNDVLEIFKKYNWPGNIRELENTIERMAVLETENKLTTENLPNEIKEKISENLETIKKDETYKYKALTFKEAKKIVISNFEKEYIKEVLKRTDGNISKAALIAGIERSNFKKLMRKNGF